ncbi:sensor histidine kinase [Sphingomonas sp.]|uniref:sensor histidine kinase n=1 Tax=Sphingomonas sp. TaxID=28214 RepID=UPI002FCC801E
MPRNEDRELALRWSNRWTLTHRILAVNIFALAILAGSLFYLDSFRSRLIGARISEAQTQAQMIADALTITPRAFWAPLLAKVGRDSGARLRVYGPGGAKQLDSWEVTGPTYELRDPAAESWPKDIARILDNGFDAIVGAQQAPPLIEPNPDLLQRWPEARRARSGGSPAAALRRAPEGTAFVSAAAAIPGDKVLLLTTNARDIRRVVRSERMTLGFILLATIALSVLLSLFLARTIARPLQHLARAAHLVRLGRAREVDVPLLPARRDEIGLLAQALHDMTHSLRYRIDATEAFAADVTHELKNPLASLRSAVDSFERVEDPELRRQLLDVVRHDVTRLDRLIGDIAEISRLDAELTRARFEPIDLGTMIEGLLPLWDARAAAHDVHIAFARPRVGSAIILGEEARLARAIDNLVDNAISFSPPGGLVEIAAVALDKDVLVTVEDEGSGVPPEVREAIFNRFHSIRPEGETFGRHSGLGLSIAKAIVEGHDGRISVEDRHGGRNGARFVLRFRGV